MYICYFIRLDKDKTAQRNELDELHSQIEHLQKGKVNIIK